MKYIVIPLFAAMIILLESLINGSPIMTWQNIIVGTSRALVCAYALSVILFLINSVRHKFFA